MEVAYYGGALLTDHSKAFDGILHGFIITKTGSV